MPANEHVYQPVIRNGLLRGLVGEWQPLPQRLQAHYISGADVDQLDRPSTATYHAIALTPAAVDCRLRRHGRRRVLLASAVRQSRGSASRGGGIRHGERGRVARTLAGHGASRHHGRPAY